MTAADAATGPGPVRERTGTRRGGSPRPGPGGTLALVESPVQLLNVLEWAYADALRTAPDATPRTPASPDRAAAPEPATGPAAATAPVAAPVQPASAAAVRTGTAGEAAAGRVAAGRVDADRAAGEPAPAPPGRGGAYRDGTGDSGGSASSTDVPGAAPAPEGSGLEDRRGGGPAIAELGENGPLTVVVLPPRDPMTRGQLRRVAELARDEGLTIRWEEARAGAGALPRTLRSLSGPLRRARRIVIGDPFSRYVQFLLGFTRAADFVVVDDGTATMEFVSQLARGERLVRWHRKGSSGARAALFAPVASRAVRRLTPGPDHHVEVFSSMPIQPPAGVAVTPNDFAWTRARFGPPRLRQGTDLVGTSLVETGVVDADHYVSAVCWLARKHGADRYFAHRREGVGKLDRIAAEAGVEIVRPDLPLELVARRGPVGRMVLSFPSTVVHTLPLALAGTGVAVAVCDVDPAWLTDGASPRAQGFLSGVSGTARDVHRLGSVRVTPMTPPCI